MGRASLEQPLDLNHDSKPESLFLEALCVPAPRTQEDVGSEPTGEVLLHVIIDKVLCFPAALKNAKSNIPFVSGLLFFFCCFLKFAAY